MCFNDILKKITDWIALVIIACWRWESLLYTYPSKGIRYLSRGALPEIGSFQEGGPARAISQKGAFGVLNGPRLGQTLTWLLEMGNITRDLKAQK